MTNKTHSYENEKIRVSFDGAKCAHAGFCFGELHDVFDGDNNPPINLAGGTIEEIIRVVEKCPSSALVYKRLDDGPDELTELSVTATIIPGGPLALRGELKLGDAKYSRLTLCRCGKSQQKPFCDGSHKQHSFDDNQTVSVEDIGTSPEPGPVSLKAIPNGPVYLDGTVRFRTIQDANLCQRDKAAICRCGASKTKPFCDGSHKSIGFEAS
jgi:CDGSH-type Zn-finger protein/uncharacterized Fe-S cluster protein YjdI